MHELALRLGQIGCFAEDSIRRCSSKGLQFVPSPWHPEFGKATVETHEDVEKKGRRCRRASLVEIDFHIGGKGLLILGTTLAGHNPSHLKFELPTADTIRCPKLIEL